MSAKIHTQQSNRANAKANLERKVVYKSVLDNPFKVNWPSVPENVSNIIFARLVSILNTVSEYKTVQFRQNKKRKRSFALERSNKRSKLATDTKPEEAENARVGGETVDDDPTQRPSLLQHMVVGTNAVTKRLEAQTDSTITYSTSHTPESEPAAVPLRYVFVCKADIDPPLLIEHIPRLVATLNSLQSSEQLILVPLPKGSDSTLATLLQLRRISVIAFDRETPAMDEMADAIKSIPTINAPWLAASMKKQHQLIPTHIKQLRTTAPKNVNLAKQERAAGRAAAKEKRTAPTNEG